MLNSVVSCQPCCVAEEVKAAPTLPVSRPCAQTPPAVSQKLAIWLDMRPKRVGVPTTIASYCAIRSEEHTSELQSLMRISYAVFCLKKKKKKYNKYKLQLTLNTTDIRYRQAK